jgi:hypothetical protein
MIYGLDVYRDAVLWNKTFPAGVDQLASSPDGTLLYVPTGEDRTADYIQVVDPMTSDVVRRVHFSSRSHDTQYLCRDRYSTRQRL